MTMTVFLSCAVLAVSALAKDATQWGHSPSSPTRVMCLGDSITHFGYCEYYLQLFENLRHPGSVVRYVNAGYSGGTVGTGLNRLPIETDRIRPDRAFVMFGMNDVRWTDYVTNAVMSAARRQAADKALTTYRADLPQLVDRILASGVRDLTLVTPTPYDEYSTVLGPRRKFVNEYGLSLAAESVRRLAAEKGLKVVDLHAALTDACRAHPGKKLCGGDSVHPGKIGHLLMASVYWRTLGDDRPVAAVTLDASGSVIRAENAAVSDVSATADALAFDYMPGALPFPDCPEYREVKAINPDFARFNREPLVVVGLKAGDWELVVDGRSLGTFSADVLSRGVNLAELDTPNRRQAAKAMEAAYRLHDFDVPRRDVACVRGSFEKFGVDMNDRDALAKRSEERLAKLKAAKYRWYGWERAASEKFLASVGREAEIAAEEDRLYAAIAAPRPVACRVEIRRTVKLSASGESTLTAYLSKGTDITAAVVKSGSDRPLIKHWTRGDRPLAATVRRHVSWIRLRLVPIASNLLLRKDDGCSDRRFQVGYNVKEKDLLTGEVRRRGPFVTEQETRMVLANVVEQAYDFIGGRQDGDDIPDEAAKPHGVKRLLAASWSMSMSSNRRLMGAFFISRSPS